MAPGSSDTRGLFISVSTLVLVAPTERIPIDLCSKTCMGQRVVVYGKERVARAPSKEEVK